MRKHTTEYIRNCLEYEGYVLLDESYIGSKDLMNLKCPKGHYYKIDFNNFFNNNLRCVHCKDELDRNRKLNEIRDYMLQYGYILTSNEYVNNSTILTCICPKQHVYEVSSANFKRGRRCSTCSRRKKLKYEYVSGYFQEYGYELLSECYVNANSKLLVKCPSEHKYSVTYGHFYDGKRCPICNESKGERRLIECLMKLNINFIRQYSSNDCKNIRVLQFDFYLPKYNILIEYDGIQHFEPVDIFGGEFSFADNIVRDAVKNSYCEDNNIRLIRIPYWDFNNIEDILTKELNLN